MSKAEVINGYTLLTPLTVKDAGCCMWTFAERSGVQFFLKQLIDPVFPDESVVTNARVLERKKRECSEFERRMTLLCRKIDSASDGNLIRIESFFRKGTKYYIAMERVMDPAADVTVISRQPFEDRILVCQTLAHSLLGLHQCGIVHGDIKPNNVLLCRSAAGKYITKLVDLDACKWESELKNPDANLVGDQIYLAPEVCRRMFGDPVDVTCKADVFAAGLLFHQYLTGTLPGFNQEEYHYAHTAVLNGEPLSISPELDDRCRSLLRRMLACEPERRCSMEEVLDELKAMQPKKRNHSERRRTEQRSYGFYAPNDGDL